MSITKIGNDQSVFNLSQRTNEIDPLARKSNPGKKINSLKGVSSRGIQVSRSQSAFNSLQAANFNLNFVAMTIRIADKSMESFETYIDQMKAELGKIIKNYPPFPPGSEKRVEFLRSFTALRKQIDQLSFAPDYKQDLKITAGSMNIPRPGDWKGVLGNRGSRPAIAGLQVFIDAAGFNIPELSENATDAEIQAAIESLQEAEKALAQKRSELATNTLSIQQFLEFNIKFDESFLGYPEALKASNMTEGIAENKSSEYKQTLMIESAKGLTEDPTQLLELIK